MKAIVCDTPVLMIIFNRPEKTNVVFDAIKKMKPNQLFIAADGPRKTKAEDIEKCKQTRSIVEKIDWECDLKTLFRDTNIGCKLGPSTAIDWFFSHVDYGIIVEDDCVPHESFFPYCDELLKKFIDDKRIMMISGINILFDQIEISDSYFFSRYHLIWGWRTWKRAWNLFDLDMKNYDKIQSDRYLKALFETKRERNFWRNIYKIAKEDKLEEWDYKWAYAMHCNNGLCVCPNRNLIKNIGNGIDATHTKDDSYHFNIPLCEMLFPLTNPEIMVRDIWADEITFEKFFNVVSLQKKILKKFSRVIGFKN